MVISEHRGKWDNIELEFLKLRAPGIGYAIRRCAELVEVKRKERWVLSIPARMLQALILIAALFPGASEPDELKQWFANPPDSARPGVYWYFMDGNLDREGMTADLEAMKAAGIGNLIFLEVNVGVPRGPVNFLSEQWQELFAHAVHEAERLGIEITLGSGPGWTGSGGPWVKPEQSMQHLVAATVDVQGPSNFQAILPVPEPRKPFFDTLPPQLIERRAAFYEDVAVLAVPTPVGDQKIADIDEKALYYRSPFSSVAGVKPYLPAPSQYPSLPADAVIPIDKVVDLDQSDEAGRLPELAGSRWPLDHPAFWKAQQWREYPSRAHSRARIRVRQVRRCRPGRTLSGVRRQIAQ